MFSKDAVRTIEIVDSRWNGTLIGAAAGLASLVILIEIDCSPSCSDDNFGKIGRWAIGSPLFAVAGALIGGTIDGLVNRTVYDGRAGQPAVTVSPLVGLNRIGGMVRIHF